MPTFEPNEYTEMAIKAKNALVDSGVPLNDTIAKIAEAEDLDLKQIRLVANFTNRFTRAALAKTASFIEFDIADADEVEKLLAAMKVDRVLAKQANDPAASFSAQQSGPVVVDSPAPKWGALIPAPDFTTLAQKLMMAKTKLAMALQNLDAQVDGLAKMASCEITPGEIMMAAAIVDGADLPFCLHFCSKKFDPDDCDDVTKYAGMELDDNDALVKAFKLLKEASHEYVELLPEHEKTAVIGALKSLGAWAVKNPMKKLTTLLLGSALASGAVKGAQTMKAGMSKGAGVPKTIRQLRSKMGAPALTPMGV